MNSKNMFITAGVILIFAVGFGAFGAHGLSPYMSDQGKTVFQTASKYHFYHGLAMWLILVLQRLLQTNRLAYAFWLFAAGITLFSGSLYLLALREHLPSAMVHVLGPITPLGGSLFIIGWIVLTLRVHRQIALMDTLK